MNRCASCSGEGTVKTGKGPWLCLACDAEVTALMEYSGISKRDFVEQQMLDFCVSCGEVDDSIVPLDENGRCWFCRGEKRKSGATEVPAKPPIWCSLGETQAGDTVVIKCGCVHQVTTDYKNDCPALQMEGSARCVAHVDGPAKWAFFEATRIHQPTPVVVIKRPEKPKLIIV